MISIVSPFLKRPEQLWIWYIKGEEQCALPQLKTAHVSHLGLELEWDTPFLHLFHTSAWNTII